MYYVLMRAFHHQYICLMHLTHHLFSVPPENEWEVNMRNGGEGGGGGGHGGGIQNLMTFPARISVRVKLLVNITPFAITQIDYPSTTFEALLSIVSCPMTVLINWKHFATHPLHYYIYQKYTHALFCVYYIHSHDRAVWSVRITVIWNLC